MQNEGEEKERPERSAGGDRPHDLAPVERPIQEHIQEHLGKQLRSTYNVMTEKPAFLGDPAVPPQFDGLIQKLEARDRQRSEAIHEQGVAAVEGALQDVLPSKPQS